MHIFDMRQINIIGLRYFFMKRPSKGKSRVDRVTDASRAKAEVGGTVSRYLFRASEGART